MDFSTIFLYFSLFISIFFEVFLLITYFEVREQIKFETEHDGKNVVSFPSVSIIVPSFNEQDTVAATIESLLALDYPKDKVSLLLIDDGSTDKTLEILNQYKENPQVRIFSKPNEGSKFSALNFALKKVETELVGCLDADSFVDSQALNKIVPYFADKEVMAVTPAIKIHEPKTILQFMQRAEYNWGVLFRRLLASMDALYVTPGPFSIFRVTVFQELGGYLHAHHTEDMEMALRMQKNGYKIVNSPTAHVYTVAPAKLKGLYKQRTRWAYGFLNNVFDYREMFFNKKYGNIGIFVLPIGTFSVFSSVYMAGNFLWSMGVRIANAIVKYQVAGGGTWHMPTLSFDWFFFDTATTTIVSVVATSFILLLLFLSLQLANGKARLSRDVLYYLTVYLFIVPLWQAKAIYSTLLRKKISWR